MTPDGGVSMTLDGADTPRQTDEMKKRGNASG